MQQKYFLFPFASSGSTTEIPDAIQSSGSVSYQEGFSSLYSEDPLTQPTALEIDRQNWNAVMYDITQNLQDYQQFGSPESIAASQNGGTAFAYDIGAIIRAGAAGTWKLFKSLVTNNTAAIVEGSNWSEVATKSDITVIFATYAANGTYAVTVPANKTRVVIRQIGGGGGGLHCQTQGSVGNLTYASGAGGGSGAYAEWQYIVTPGSTISIIVGSGGLSDAAGVATTVTIGSVYCTTNGGLPGKYNSGNSSAGGQGGTISTSSGLNLIASIQGGWGSDGMTNQFLFAGNGAASFFGGGGRAGVGATPAGTTQANSAGNAGRAPGSGGGGAYSPNLESATFYFGGQGADGAVFLEFWTK